MWAKVAGELKCDCTDFVCESPGCDLWFWAKQQTVMVLVWVTVAVRHRSQTSSEIHCSWTAAATGYKTSVRVNCGGKKRKCKLPPKTLVKRAVSLKNSEDWFCGVVFLLLCASGSEIIFYWGKKSLHMAWPLPTIKIHWRWLFQNRPSQSGFQLH